MSAVATLAAFGVLGIASACSKDGPVDPVDPDIAAPSNLTATVVSETQIDVAWTDNSTNETGFAVESCSGPACANFTQVGTVAANVTTFSHMDLTAGTSYSYRVRATGAQGASAYSSTATAITGEPGGGPTGPAPILVGAGEITSCHSSAGPAATAQLIQAMLSDTNVTVFTAGHNLDDVTPGGTFETCFDPTWGAFKDRTFYAIGNNDYAGGRGKAGVFGYFGERAGPDGKGWYSFDRGDWHIVVLNTATWDFGTTQMVAGSEQVNWLINDLQQTQKRCIMAISWERRFYSGSGTWHRQGNLDAIWDALYEAGADVFVSAKDHWYERYAPSDPVGNIDEARGIRQFVVGTGGRTRWNVEATNAAPNVEVRDASTWGVLKFTLNADNYAWEFVPTVPGGFTDSGTTQCH
jgi:hypothetical protein